ncbi:MAG: hypothetical protein KDI78_06670 [Xanthomonadales bacterium]|nr:hypothetical protein [Xanthomonadales bacterium]
MSKHLAIVVDWYGPYTPEQAIAAAAEDFESGLYLGIGKIKHQKAAATPQYVGLSKNIASRLRNHSKLPDITRDTKIWLGEVATAGVPGKSRKKTQTTIDLAEWALSYFMKLPLNTKKRKNPPDRAMTLLNRWWRIDYETPWRKRPHQQWPDLIDYVDPEYPARIVWFGGRMKSSSPWRET